MIGVGPDRSIVGLQHDYLHVKPPNGDGFVNWLTTHLINALDHTAVSRVRSRIVLHEGSEICRVDVARSPRPLWARTSSKDRVFFVRLNNSTRVRPEDEQATYIAEHWPKDWVELLTSRKGAGQRGCQAG